MAIEFKTPEEVAAQYLQELKLLKPEINTDQTDSDWWIRAQALGGVVSGIYSDQRLTANDAFPQRARREALARHLETWFPPPDNVFKQSSQALGNVIASGATGSFVGAGSPLTYLPTGNVYLTTADKTLDAPTGLIPVVSVGTGQAQNLLSGALLSFNTAPAGFDSTVTVDGDNISDGRDEENNAQAAARILLKIQAPLAGGKETDYEQFALSADPTVTSANVLRFPFGFGTVAIIITAGTADIDAALDNNLPVIITPSEALVEKVQAYVDTQKIITDCVFVSGANEISVDVTVKVRYASGNNSTIVAGTGGLTQEQVVQREVKRALYKTPAGGRQLGGSGFVVASEIEEVIDMNLSSEPYTIGRIKMLLDRQVEPLAATGFNRLILGNEAAIPGTLSIVEM